MRHFLLEFILVIMNCLALRGSAERLFSAFASPLASSFLSEMVGRRKSTSSRGLISSEWVDRKSRDNFLNAILNHMQFWSPPFPKPMTSKIHQNHWFILPNSHCLSKKVFFNNLFKSLVLSSFSEFLHNKKPYTGDNLISSFFWRVHLFAISLRILYVALPVVNYFYLCREQK